jgi:hypothetical protein
MTMGSIRWTRAILGALAAEIGQVAATVAWVAVYSYVIAPGQPVEAYQAHAQLAGPWVSILGGAPIFYAASRWIARDRPTALALFGLFVLVDVALLIAMTEPGAGLPPGIIALSFATKAFVCWLGGRHGEAHSAS